MTADADTRPLLPAWATDTDIRNAAAWLATEITVTLHAEAGRQDREAARAALRERQTRADADRITAEAEALLTRESEGWFPPPAEPDPDPEYFVTERAPVIAAALTAAPGWDLPGAEKA